MLLWISDVVGPKITHSFMYVWFGKAVSESTFHHNFAFWLPCSFLHMSTLNILMWSPHFSDSQRAERRMLPKAAIFCPCVGRLLHLPFDWWFDNRITSLFTRVFLAFTWRKAVKHHVTLNDRGVLSLSIVGSCSSGVALEWSWWAIMGFVEWMTAGSWDVSQAGILHNIDVYLEIGS